MLYDNISKIYVVDKNEKYYGAIDLKDLIAALLFLGMGVSSVVGMFEAVAAVLPVAICFQSLVLDMAGNVGTQSLAVTIRVLMLVQ